MNPIYQPTATEPSDFAVRERIGSAALAMRLGQSDDASTLLREAQTMSEQIAHVDNAIIQAMTIESLS